MKDALDELELLKPIPRPNLSSRTRPEPYSNPNAKRNPKKTLRSHVYCQRIFLGLALNPNPSAKPKPNPLMKDALSELVLLTV